MNNRGLFRIEVEIDEITANALAELRGAFVRTRHGHEVVAILEYRGFSKTSDFERDAWQRIFREAVLAHVAYLETHGMPAAGARLELTPERCPRHVEEKAMQAAIERVLAAAVPVSLNEDLL